MQAKTAHCGDMHIGSNRQQPRSSFAVLESIQASALRAILEGCGEPSGQLHSQDHVQQVATDVVEYVRAKGKLVRAQVQPS